MTSPSAVNTLALPGGRQALLALAERLGNVSQACAQFGCSRDTYYRSKRLHEQHGEAALQAAGRRQPRPKNRVPPPVEAAVLALAARHPAWGPARVGRELAGSGLAVSANGVRGVWLRHGMTTIAERIRATPARGALGTEPAPATVPASAAPLRRPPSDRGKDNSTTAANLLTAAFDLFAERNYSTVTIKDIALATGINTSLIYYYFENKEGLFLKVVEQASARAFETFTAIRSAAASPREVIALWIENHALQFPLMQKLIKISIDYANTHQHSPTIDKAIRRFYDIEAEVLGEAIRAGMAAGDFAAADVPRTITFVSTFLDGVLVRSVMMSEFDYAAAIHDLRDFILEQLSAN